jgi:hypothetical protein
MSRGVAAAVAAVIASACVIIVDDHLDAGGTGAPVPVVDSGFDGNGFGPGDGPTNPPPDPPKPPLPGSGKDGDHGTAMLVMVRIDQGTANIADALQAMVETIQTGLKAAGLEVTSVAVSELYDTEHIWAMRPGLPPVVSLATALRQVSATRTAVAPSTCSTSALASIGPNLFSWNLGAAFPFSPAPGALLVVLVDSGARAQPLTVCPSSLFSASSPVTWVHLGRMMLQQTHFVAVATPEDGDTQRMQVRCAKVPGFPGAGLDAIAASSTAFFDPLAAQMNASSAGLADRVDLCDALGTGLDGKWEAIGTSWRQALEKLR